MIPLILSLRNFMCYRDKVELSLEGIHVACICGDNGHGKSALLDAMTWALWGRARAKRDDELVSQGRSDMEVELEFAVGSNRYRVIRKVAKATLSPRNPQKERAGQSLLELHLLSGEVWLPLTGNNQRETQRILQNIVRMDYQTFVNSAFLLQGRADEFTKKQPAERKEVLAEILGLSLYDEMEERARAEARERDVDLRRLAVSIQEIEAEVARRPQLEDEERQLRELLGEFQGQVRTQEEALDLLRRGAQDAQNKMQQKAEIERRLAELGSEITALTREMDERRRGLREHESLLGQRLEIEQEYAALMAARKENDDLGQAAARYAELSARQSEVQRRLQETRAQLQAQEAATAERLRQVRARAEPLQGLQSALDSNAIQLKALDEQETALQHLRAHLREVAERRQTREGEKLQLDAQIKTLAEKVDLLKHGDDRCPLCESELGSERLQIIEGKYKVEGRASVQQLNITKEDVARLRREEESAEKEMREREQRLQRERIALETRAGTLKQQVEDATRAHEEAAEAATRCDELHKRLSGGDYGLAEQTTLRELASEIARLSYDTQRHQALRRQLAGLEPFDQRHRALLQAEAAASQEKALLGKAEESLGRRQAQLEAEEARQAILEKELAGLPDYGRQIAAAQETLDSLRRRRDIALQGAAEVREKLARCRRLEEEKQAKLTAHRKAAEEKGIFDELAAAFGKKGIQALLIEAALPEIEDEANRLLGLMTDNCMRVKIETQRDTRSGDTIETLDIKIADESAMVRNYELFSGGEAFRINFALRVALSKLLARRAGAPLPTLVIDEGFGSQDASGRDKLVEAINSVQDDFQRILVITHIEELKEAFPVRIAVTKTAEGSRISVY